MRALNSENMHAPDQLVALLNGKSPVIFVNFLFFLLRRDINLCTDNAIQAYLAFQE